VSWRYDREECLAIAAEVFARIVRKYGGVSHPKYGIVTEARHWMAIFKSSLSREFHTFAYEARAYAEAQRQWGEEELKRGGEVDYNEGGLATILAGASQELREVMGVVAGAPTELLKLLLEEADDQTWSRRLCRLGRISTMNEGIVTELRNLLSGESI
jgi:hypothetical protein